MKHLMRVVIVVGVAVGLLSAPLPADAESGDIVFTGTMVMFALWLPGFGPPGNGTWTLGANGVGASTSGGAGAASISLSGQAHVGLGNVFGYGAFCGLFAGSDGVGTVVVPPEVSVVNFGWRQSTSDVIVAYGNTTNGSGQIVGGIVAVMTVSGGAACINGANSFTVVGTAELTY
jgi:hypothetical protein